MSNLAPLPSPSTPVLPDKEVLTKWTIVNDEWVQAQFLLARGKSGLSDRPATETRSAS